MSVAAVTTDEAATTTEFITPRAGVRLCDLAPFEALGELTDPQAIGGSVLCRSQRHDRERDLIGFRAAVRIVLTQELQAAFHRRVLRSHSRVNQRQQGNRRRANLLALAAVRPSSVRLLLTGEKFFPALNRLFDGRSRQIGRIGAPWPIAQHQRHNQQARENNPSPTSHGVPLPVLKIPRGS